MMLQKPVFEGEQKILTALENKKVFDFVKKAYLEHYKRHFKQHENEINEMVIEAFTLLRKSVANGWNYRKLEKAVFFIDAKIFRKNDSAFWFNREYKEYKKKVRPKIEYEEIKKFLAGKIILDFGSGTGSLALELERRGYKILTTDILDYRFNETKHIFFKKMNVPFDVDVPFDNIDTVLIKAVLHHVSQKYLIPILANLSKITKRIIVEESVYGIPKNLPGLQKIIREQPLFEEFMRLPKDDQYSALTLFCFFSNALAFGKPEMNLPFEFKTVSEWKKVFNRMKFEVRKVDILGFEPSRITPDSRVQFICDVKH